MIVQIVLTHIVEFITNTSVNPASNSQGLDLTAALLIRPQDILIILGALAVGGLSIWGAVAAAIILVAYFRSRGS